MSFIKRCKKLSYILTSRTAMLVIGFLCLFLLIWFGGPLIAIAGFVPLKSILARVILILCIILAVAVTKIYQLSKQSKRNTNMAEELIDDSVDNDDINEEINTLKNRMSDAIALLKDVKLFKGRNIYQLPWYIMIGPPGAGKTTIINNSGLDYPLKDKLGVDLIKGVGGTRNCDWWFTNKAVLIDTAGRYTTQDSHAKHDSKAWQGFLGLLRKYRPLRPINGVVISMGISELMGQTKTERNLHARAIKQRLQELQNQLGMTFPVYVILSKADLIDGFRDFFNELTEEESDQIWGITFPMDSKNGTQIEQFNKEFHGLIANLTGMLNRRLINERDESVRAKVFEFPHQLRFLQEVSYSFLKEIFTPNTYEQPPVFRGVYLTSATQEGAPSSFLSDKKVANSSHINKSRSFFIKKVLESVVFPEQNLASTNKYHDKQNKWLRISAVSIGCFGLLGFGFLAYGSYLSNSKLIEQTDQLVTQYKKVDSGVFDTNNLVVLNDRLNALRDLPAINPDAKDQGSLVGVGLDKMSNLKQASMSAYERSLKTYLEPYMVKVLLSEMKNNAEHLSYLYETLRTYLMLYMPEHFDASDVEAWFDAYFDRKLPGDKNIQIRADLHHHLATLLSIKLGQTQMDSDAVHDARLALTKLPVAERAYQRLRADYMNSSIPPFRLTDIISAKTAESFELKDPSEASNTIPGLYTYNGFYGIFNVEKSKMLGTLISSNWVYGKEAAGTYDVSKQQVEKELERRYFQDYIYYWKTFLDNLKVKDFNSVSEGIKVTNALSGPEAPIKNIISVVQRNVALTNAPESQANGALKKAADLAGGANAAIAEKAERINKFLPESVPAKQLLPGHEVEEAFQGILSLDPAKLDKVQSDLKALNVYLNKISQSDDMTVSIKEQLSGKGEPDFISQLSSSDIVAPFSDWLKGVAGDTSNIVKINADRVINKMWRNDVLPEYRAAIAGRYPISKNSKQEISLKDFTHFFGPGGTLDKFFTAYVAPSVNMGSDRWSFKRDIGMSLSSLTMFHEAYRIRKVFFDNSSGALGVGFGLKPEVLDRSVSSIKLDINGQSLVYRHGPQRVISMSWPGPQPLAGTKVEFSLIGGGRLISQSYDGEWSFFRMLDALQSKRSKTAKDLNMHFDVEGNHAVIKLLPNSVRNPFWNDSLESFTCPSKL
ncbi:type VI secretion system membrane subunit TssM [Marinomonas spartinae]|uniref:type VI secretion system membrane subunit TssM n=1 Tax=Marinomonas spartinae TaxID=1792290 RepID=UPI0018F14752|nr:type VI secretion system membrane subunit TssM [Marinomonas spartinae]MBJ7554759.1 type VI secretion system membrane subunit TssM [Marinomonas spartinae]